MEVGTKQLQVVRTHRPQGRLYAKEEKADVEEVVTAGRCVEMSVKGVGVGEMDL